ncbi:ELKS/Rab6-interacting/CAST family member 1 [Varanus komodoensis]|nr:ELKS/Rab6-interacting/CAST family member 1 [Varanus komodoensis]
MSGKSVSVTIIPDHALVADAEEEIKNFYAGVQEENDRTPKEDILIILDDWNAKSGNNAASNVVGEFGLGVEELMMAMEKVKQELESMKAKLSSTQQSLAEKETHLTNLRAERRKHLEEVLEMNISGEIVAVGNMDQFRTAVGDATLAKQLCADPDNPCDKTAILVAEGQHSPRCPAVTLPELMEVVLDLLLRTPQVLVLRDFNIHAEAALFGATQDFMSAMIILELSLHVTDPVHEKGHTLDLVFSIRQKDSGLDVAGLILTSLSCADHFLVRFRLLAPYPLCKGGDPIKTVHPQRLMDSDGFWRALREYPADMTGAAVEAQVTLWNMEVT